MTHRYISVFLKVVHYSFYTVITAKEQASARPRIVPLDSTFDESSTADTGLFYWKLSYLTVIYMHNYLFFVCQLFG